MLTHTRVNSTCPVGMSSSSSDQSARAPGKRSVDENDASWSPIRPTLLVPAGRKRSRAEGSAVATAYGESALARLDRLVTQELSWDWYPNHVSRLVRFEHVPPVPDMTNPPSRIDPTNPTLPTLPCHELQVLAALVTLTKRQDRLIEETRAETQLLKKELELANDKISELTAWNKVQGDYHRGLVAVVHETRTEVGELVGRNDNLTAHLGLAVDRIRELEQQQGLAQNPEEANPEEEDPEEADPEEEDPEEEDPEEIPDEDEAHSEVSSEVVPSDDEN